MDNPIVQAANNRYQIDIFKFVLNVKGVMIKCANVSEARYFNTMTPEHKNSWKCPLCWSKAPKKGNVSTPAHKLADSDI